jgi:hypothetical protein
MGDMTEWLTKNWFDLISITGVVGGLFFTALSLHSETKTRRIANFLAVTASYREIWKEFLNQPKLARVLDANADVVKQPITQDEEVFVNMVILHISTTYYAMNDELLIKLEGSHRDIAEFFSLPVPKAVWNTTKLLQNQDFAAFVEASLKKS